MNAMRERAKEYFPTVLLTLLSIVQAFALELLWSYLRETSLLFELSWLAAISWLQILATFLGLVLIWVVYASSVMRFRWVPVTSDSVYPFLIGIMEFTLIETLGPDSIGLWLILLGVIFAVMTLVSHANMRRARQDPDNRIFFEQYDPAKLPDFYPQLIIVAVLMLAGLYLLLSGNQGAFALLAVLATICLLGWQFHAVALFWRRTVTDAPDV